MALFKKKKRLDEDFEDEFEDEEIEEERTQKIKKKKFKDLNPENKKKRKEPPKPWGRKERVIVFIVFALTAGISAYLLLVSSGFILNIPKAPDLQNIHFPEVKFEKTIIIENDQR